MMNAKPSIYETVTEAVIQEMEQGAVPWVKPWKAGASLPYNLVSQKPYSGVNVLCLWRDAFVRGYGTHGWATFRQITELGGHVRRGEHGTPIVYAKKIIVEDKETEQEKKIGILKGYTVFNVEQCEGLPARLYSHVDIPQNFPEAQALVDRIGAWIVFGGDQACFVPSLDRIHLPLPETFTAPEHYYATNLHEHVHWSGHEKRLRREFGMRFGDLAYAAEELVAELGAAFLCARFGIAGELRHAGYLEHWLSLLKADKRAIFTAAAKAQEANEYLLTLNVPVEVAP